MTNVYFKTFGCPTNFSESEQMKAMLSKYDFEIIESPEEAFVLIFNICTVKGNITPLNEIRKAVEAYPHKKIIVAGCITEDIIPEIREIKEEVSLISTHNIKEILQVVEETINDNPINVLSVPENPEIKIGGAKSPIAIIPICSGCNGNCSYCSVRLVKGELFSYPMDKLLEEAQKNITQGAKEIWITAQDTASYMLDKEKKSKLPELITKITKIPGNFKIRIGMMNVNNIYPVLDEMIEVYRNDKVFKFIHLPIQSGSDAILEKMNRKYYVRKFKTTIKTIRDAIPDITLSTDMITGFPGETKLDFQESIKIIDEIQPDVLNVNKFRQRPGTEAEKMKDQVPEDIAKQRAKHIISIFEWGAYRKNKQWLNWTGNIIIEEKGKEGTNTYTGRNSTYKPIIVEGEFNIGDIKKVKITGFTNHDLRAVLI